MSVLAIVQARMGSSRLPGKVLKPILHKPLLWHIVNRLRFVSKIEKIIIATSDNEQDKSIVKFCLEHGIDCFIGNEDDVLDRFYQAAQQYKGDPIIRVTADCPFVDPFIIDQLISFYVNGCYDYVGISTGAGAYYLKGGRFPDGLDAECISFGTLQKAWLEADNPLDREHVTPYIWRNKNIFFCGTLTSENDYSHLRLTVDHEDDYRLAVQVYEALYNHNAPFSLADIINYLEKNPHIKALNKNYIDHEGYEKLWHLEGEPLRKNDKTNQRIVNTQKGQALYNKAKKLIPGGTQLLSKRPEMFLPDHWPPYYKKAKGIEVEDIDGNIYLDMSIMGVGSCILGYSDPDVDQAVKQVIDNGSMCTLNAPEEVELAELLCQLHPWAQMVRYTRSGGEAMAVAIRIARAYTKRDKIAFCGYHGWSDWYIAANLGQGDLLDGHLLPGLEPTGVPRGLRNTAVPFSYNHIEQLENIVKNNRDTLAAIVMEPRRDSSPLPDFLEGVRKIADHSGAVLVFDEITTGFRMNPGGIHLKLGVNPDMAVFAKSMANGYPMAAIIGKQEVMQAAQTSFISSTNWTERIGPVAAIATIKKYIQCKVAEHITNIGSLVAVGWQEAAEKNSLQIKVNGLPSLNHFSFIGEKEQILSTLFTKLMLEKGYLAFNQFKPSYAHSEQEIKKYLEAVNETFADLTLALEQNNIEEKLNGPPAKKGFYRLT